LARLGIAGEYSRVRDARSERSFTLASLPAGLERDTTDDILNPTLGHRIELSLTPFVPVGSEGSPFVKGRVDASAYWDLTGDGGLVLAGRAGYGAIAGAELVEIPADKRFYAGGGGSVRGFAFRHAGELDAADDPVGGRSVAEAGLELRIRIGEDFGVVPFIEAGRAYNGTMPDFDEKVFVGAGLGVRYYTSIGPLRLDVGVPLNKRDSDAPFQIYVSLGQAF
jgi:translocation and assembly module TamA